MHTITFFPLGNADCYRVDLSTGGKLLFDYADMRCVDDPADKRIDLPAELRADLKAANRDAYDVVAFTHLDDDHVCGASQFFELRHAAKYQGGGRVKITELWVPAYAITELETELPEDGRIIQAEARHRLVAEGGKGIKVFSRPDALKDWLAERGVTLESRRHCFVDAGTLVPGWTKQANGVEFFVHSPFAKRQNDGSFADRNMCSLVFQAVFVVDGVESKVLLAADTHYEVLAEMVEVTRSHNRDERLAWDLVKLPHHCSYNSLGPEKGVDITTPDPSVAWMYEAQGQPGGRIVSTSDPIPASGDQKQPPHRQSANYYRQVTRKLGGEFLVTMTHPNGMWPEPLVVQIDRGKLSVRKASTPVGAIALSSPAPRAG